MVFFSSELIYENSKEILHENNFELIFKLRESLYTLLENYLSPNNHEDIASKLKEKLNAETRFYNKITNSNETLIQLLQQKMIKARVLKNFILELLENRKTALSVSSFEHDEHYDILSDKDIELCIDIVLNDLIYYGSITPILSYCLKDSDFKELLPQDSLYHYYKQNFLFQTILEIQINNHQEIFIETKQKSTRLEINFISEEQLKSIIERLIHESNKVHNTNHHISFSKPILDFELAFNKFRASSIVPPASKEHCLTIRIHPKQAYDLDYLESEGMFNHKIKEFLRACQRSGLNIAIAGTMGTGKTTLLSALCDEWDGNSRKAIIEDTPEISPNNENIIFLKLNDYRNSEENIDIYKLVKACKRHSIKYIALSEARDGAAWEILQLSQNILGCLMTFHFSVKHSDREISKALDNLTYLCKLNPNSPSEESVRHLSSKILDVLILLQQDPISKKRIIKSISHIQGYDPIHGGHFKFLELFSYTANDFSLVNRSEELEDYFLEQGVNFKFQ